MEKEHHEHSDHEHPKKEHSGASHEHKHTEHAKEHHEHSERTHEHKHTEHKAHKSAEKEKKPDVDLWRVASIALAVILFIVVVQFYLGGAQTGDAGGKQTTTNTGTSAGGSGVPANLGPALEKYKADIGTGIMKGDPNAPIVVVEFSDFECPFCQRFFNDAYKGLMDYVERGEVLFVYRHLPLSFHPNAMNAAIAAECAREQDEEKFWEYHDTLFANMQAMSVTDLKKYAADLGLDTEQFNSCLDSQKYKSQVEADAQYAQSKGLSGTPSFLINGVPLVGAQPLAAFEAQFEAASNPVDFTVYALGDARCIGCATAGLIQTTRQLFPSAEIIEVDVKDSAGQQFITDLGITIAPALIFEKKVTQTAGWKSNEAIQPLFIDKGEYYVLDPEATGASWIIDDEQREVALQQTYEKLDLVKGDNRPQVDFFVMSYCPYGNQAEELLKPIYDELKDEADFYPRYVIYGQGTGCLQDSDGSQYCSLHGRVELNQNIRELCVFEQYGQDSWFDFALAMNTACTQTNADTCWTGVAQGLGLDTAAIAACETSEGLRMSREQYELNQLLGVSGSPTVFFEGQQYNGARSVEGYMQALCAGFENRPAACANVPDEPVQAAVPQGSC